MFRNILVHLGNRATADVAVGAAAKLATTLGASVAVMDVIGADPRQVWATCDETGRVAARRAREHRVRTLDAADRLVARGVDVTATHVCEGDELANVLRCAEAGGHDLVLKAADQGTTQDEMFAGTLDWRLMRRSAVPLWLARPGAIGRVAAAVEATAYETQPDSLDLAVLRAADAMAKAHGAECHVLHAYDPDAEGAVDMLAPLMASCDLDVPADRVHRVPGRCSHALPRWCAEQQVGLLVLGTASPTGTALGEGTAEGLVRRAPGSVLTLRVEPAGPGGAGVGAGAAQAAAV